MARADLRCDCGKITGHLADYTPDVGTHAVCHCRSCRAAELHCGAPDPGEDGVGIFQTSPWRLTLDGGQDQLAAFSFGETNLIRWRAACCGVPMFNTLRNPKVSFVGIRTSAFVDPAAPGPISGHAFVPKSDGKTRHEGLGAFIWGFAKRTIANRLSGRWKRNPLFDTDTGKPVAEVTVLPDGTRAALLDAAR